MLCNYCFCVSAFMLPFVSSIDIFRKILYPLGSGFFLFSCIGICLWIMHIRSGSILLPSKKISFCVVLFIISIIISGIANIENMLHLEWQTVLGVNRFIMSIFLITMQFLISIYAYNIWIRSEYIHHIFFNCLLYGFVVSGIVGILEIISIFGVLDVSSILSFIDDLYRGDLGRQAFRVSSVAGEPSFYAIYLGFITPFLLWKYYKCGSIFMLFCVNLLFLMVLGTYSRTAYGIILLECFVYSIFFYKEIFRKKFKYTRKLFVIEILFFLFMVNFFSIDFVGDVFGVFCTLIGDNAFSQMSNLTRLGSSIAALNIFYEYPLFGIGYDQFAYFASEYYPDWAYQSMEIKKLAINYTSRSFWPSVYNYYARLLCEVGVVGFLSFILIISSVFKEAYKSLVRSSNEKTKMFLVSFLGSCLSMFSGSDLSDVFCLSFALLLAEIKLSELGGMHVGQ